MPHILLVEDEALVRLALKMALTEAGFEVSTAEDGAAALEAVAAAAFDIVVTDLQMPRMGGLELVAALHQRRPELPVVVTTGCGPVDDGEAFGKLRARGIPVIQKPFMPEAVADAVRARLGLGRGAGASHHRLGREPSRCYEAALT